MKNTIKLILIIFFSIIYSQDIDMTGTEWECDRRAGKISLTFKENNYLILNEYGSKYTGTWHTVLSSITLDIKLGSMSAYTGTGLLLKRQDEIIYKNDSACCIGDRKCNRFILSSSSLNYIASKYDIDISSEISIKKQYPDLFLPKDEFESTEEYNQRLERQGKLLEDKVQKLVANENAKQDEKRKLEAEKTAEKERKLEIRIAESLEPVGFIIEEIGSYNADSEEFSRISLRQDFNNINYKIKQLDIEIKKLRKQKNRDSIHDLAKQRAKLKVQSSEYTALKITFDNIHIPRSEARTFKENYSDAKVEGYKKLNKDLDLEYFCNFQCQR